MNRRTLLTHLNKVSVVPRDEIIERRQLVGDVKHVLARIVAPSNSNRLSHAEEDAIMYCSLKI